MSQKVPKTSYQTTLFFRKQDYMDRDDEVVCIRGFPHAKHHKKKEFLSQSQHNFPYFKSAAFLFYLYKQKL